MNKKLLSSYPIPLIVSVEAAPGQLVKKKYCLFNTNISLQKGPPLSVDFDGW